MGIKNKDDDYDDVKHIVHTPSKAYTALYFQTFHPTCLLTLSSTKTINVRNKKLIYY